MPAAGPGERLGASLAMGQGCPGMLPTELPAFHGAQGAAAFVSVFSRNDVSDEGNSQG